MSTTAILDKWDAWNAGGGPKYPHEKVVQFCFRRYASPQRSGVRALDLGCGSGVHTVFLAAEGFQATGIDVSDVGLANTRAKLDSLALSAQLHAQSADVLDFAPATFDLVVCVGTYDSAGPGVAKSSVRKVSKLLRLGGLGLFIFASDRDYRVCRENPFRLHGYTSTEVWEMFASHFARVSFDRYVTTYQGGCFEQNEWLVTVER
jgi:cyclopropane fatty-acyl-phospholipid synthase-like methyltransferase